MGVQKLIDGYTQVSPSDLMSGYTPEVKVSGASAEGEQPVSLRLKAAYSAKSQVMSKKDISKIQSDYSLIKVTYDFGDTVPAPIKAGDRIGSATFSYGNDVQFTAELTAESDIDVYQPPENSRIPVSESDTQSEKNLGQKSSHSFEYMIDGVIILIIAGIALCLFVKKKPGSTQRK